MPGFDPNPELAEFSVADLADLLCDGDDLLLTETDPDARAAIIEVRPAYLQELIAREALEFASVPARFLA